MTEPDYLGLQSRLTKPPSDLTAAAAFGTELRAAEILHPLMGLVDAAHVAALFQAGILPAETARTLVAGLADLGTIPATEIEWDPSVGDVYNNRDRLLKSSLGSDVAAWLSTGRARREATTGAWVMATRDRLLALHRSVADLVGVLLAVSTEHRSTLMSDFTYLQHAQPTTLAHYLLSFAAPLGRDLERVEHAIAGFDACPLGGGSVNGSRFNLDRELLASLLGFRSVRVHTRDAMWAPDIALEAMAVAISAATTVDRLVAEFLIWTTAEFGYVDLDDRHSRTSVIMPQKKNPYALTHVRATCREMVGVYTNVVVGQLTPTGQPDNRIYSYEHLPTALDRLELALRLLTEVIDGAEFNLSALETAANTGYLYSTDLCDYLTVEHTIPNRVAHRIVGLAVRDAAGDPITARVLQRAGDELGVDLPALDEAAIAANRDPRRIVESRQTPGGAAAAQTTAIIQALDEDRTASLARAGKLACNRDLESLERKVWNDVHALISKTNPKSGHR